MKVEDLPDPGGQVSATVQQDGAQTTETKKTTDTVNSDSDSGLDTSSLRSNSKTATNQTPPDAAVAATPDDKENFASDRDNDATAVCLTISRRRNKPFMGMALKRNPDLSEIARNEQKLCYQCYECGNKMAKRQPLTKTNGILFMKNREEEVLNDRFYQSIWDCAFTRSEIVQTWNDELVDHIDFCHEELEVMYHYETRFNLKFGIKRNTIDSNLEMDNSAQAESPEKMTAIAKIQQKIRDKMWRSKSRDSLNQVNGGDAYWTPPPPAKPKPKPKVISRPLDEENTDINFSGILQSTVLRQHCEQCVLRNKPAEFQSVLFVCQL